MIVRSIRAQVGLAGLYRECLEASAAYLTIGAFDVQSNQDR